MTRGGLDAYERLGLGLAGAFAAWILLSAVVRDTNPWPSVAVLATATGAYALGRAWGRQYTVLLAIAIVLAVLVSTGLGGADAFSGSPLAPPLGYANANGALFTVGLGAAAILAFLADRASGSVLAAALLGLAIITMSGAAAALAGSVFVVALLANRLGRWTALAAPLVVLGVVAVTVVLGTVERTSLVTGLEARLTERRTALWTDALQLTAREPVFGVGPGMFHETSPTALADADARWAHSAYLQTAAEVGVIGLALLGLLLLWVYGSLYRSRQDTRVVVLGTAILTATAAHAAIDYLAHFPALVAITALLIGVASSREQVPAVPAGSIGPIPFWRSYTASVEHSDTRGLPVRY